MYQDAYIDHLDQIPQYDRTIDERNRIIIVYPSLPHAQINQYNVLLQVKLFTESKIYTSSIFLSSTLDDRKYFSNSCLKISGIFLDKRFARCLYSLLIVAILLTV